MQKNFFCISLIYITQVGTTLDLRIILAMFLGTFASVVGFCLVLVTIKITIVITIAMSCSIMVAMTITSAIMVTSLNTR